jgi:NAD(P)-dependent dehydrogenase (short-subunit alcohol dehydrogenase family)
VIEWDLENRVALVTGAGRGIGRTIAHLFAKSGAKVVLASRTQDEIGAVHEEITSSGGVSVPIVTDVTDVTAVDALINNTLEEFERIDVLINNAGISYVANLVMSDDTRWNEVIQTNLMGVYHCTKAVLRPMIRARHGRVINVASVSGLVGAAFNSAYAASKSAVIGLTKSVALEVAPMGITVNAICPWYVDTDLATETMGARGKMFGKTAEEYLDELTRNSPQGRPISTEEVASLAAFLATPEARGITGQALNLSGGAVTI